MQQANVALSQCLWRNAIAFSEERESAEIVGKAVSDACSDERDQAHVAQHMVMAPNSQITSADIRDFQSDMDREAMTDVVRARAGRCNLAS